MKDLLISSASASASTILRPSLHDTATIVGHFSAECVAPDGSIRWREDFDNIVTTVGKNVILDAALAGGSYTTVGPYMGLVSSVGWASGSVGDTMTSHSGWTEAGNANAPTYTAPRKTCAWSAAATGSKALSAALSFAITGTGTLEGCFIVFFTGAVSTIDNTSGTLLSVGAFATGARLVQNLDTVNVSYSLGL